MPLIKSKSEHAFKENIKKELQAGRPMKQSLAISYATKRAAAKKMANGGVVDSDITTSPTYEQKKKFLDTPTIGASVRKLMQELDFPHLMSEGGQVVEDDRIHEDADEEANENEINSMHMEDDFLSQDMDMNKDMDHEEDPIVKKKKMVASLLKSLK